MGWTSTSFTFARSTERVAADRHPGWPGSVIGQLKIVGPLTNPTADGASATDAFDVVIPSMPGYGFSGKPTTAGWDPPHRARVGRADETPWIQRSSWRKAAIGARSSPT